jgi:putative ABC transport system permease protein
VSSLAKVLSFLRFALESVVKNGRRSLFAILGVVLSLSLISGSLIAVDSSGMTLLRSAIDGVPWDYDASDTPEFASVNETLLSSKAKAIESVEHVEAAAPIASYHYVDYRNDAGKHLPSYYPGYGTVELLPHNSSKILETHRIAGELPRPGTVAISKYVSRILEIGPGDNITCSFMVSHYDAVNDSYVSMSVDLVFEVSAVWSQTKIDVPNIQLGYSVNLEDYDSVALYGSGDPIVANMADAHMIEEPLANVTEFSTPYVSYMIWIDRDRVIDIADLKGTLNTLEGIRHRLSQVGSTSGYQLRTGMLEPAIEWLRPEMNRLKLMSSALSLPVLVLGVYLSIVGVELGSTSRRQEIGTLKSRGASNSQVFGLLLSESFVLGVVSGIGGLMLGLLVSRTLVDTAASLSSHVAVESYSSGILLTVPTILLSVGAGVALVFASTYRSFKRISRMEVSETLHRYMAKAARVDYNPRSDILMLILAGVSALAAFSGDESMRGQLANWMLSSVVSLVVMVGHLLLFVMPLLLAISIVRLVTRGSGGIYAGVTKLTRPLTKELHYLVKRNMRRHPRKASNFCLIISLALAFGLFISITVESSIAYQERLACDRVGADVRIAGLRESHGDIGQSVNLTDMLAIGSLPSAREVLFFQTLSIGSQGGYQSRVSVFDSDQYLEVVKASDFYFMGNSEDKLAHLKTNGSVLITEDTARLRSILTGDFIDSLFEFELLRNGSSEVHNWSLHLTVAGITKALPGFPFTEMYLDWTSFGEPLFNEFYPMSLESAGALVNLKPGSNETDVADAAEVVVRNSGLSPEIVLLSDAIQESKNEPFYRSLSGYMFVEYGLSIAIMSVGVGLLTLATVADREQELACIMARGTSKSQVGRLLFGEFLSLLLIGIMIGVSVGLFTGFLFNEAVARSIYNAAERATVLGWSSLIVVFASVGALVTASALATVKASRLKLADILRIRSG